MVQKSGVGSDKPDADVAEAAVVVSVTALVLGLVIFRSFSLGVVICAGVSLMGLLYLIIPPVRKSIGMLLRPHHPEYALWRAAALLLLGGLMIMLGIAVQKDGARAMKTQKRSMSVKSKRAGVLARPLARSPLAKRRQPQSVRKLPTTPTPQARRQTPPRP